MLWSGLLIHLTGGRIETHFHVFGSLAFLAFYLDRDDVAHQQLPGRCVTSNIWQERFEDIAAFERYLARNGTVILKFFLHVSKAVQKQRFLARLDTPGKEWKFNAADLTEREFWDDYMAAYEDALTEDVVADLASLLRSYFGTLAGSLGDPGCGQGQGDDPAHHQP